MKHKFKKNYQHTILLCTGHGEGQHKCRKWSPQKEELQRPNRLNAFCFENVGLKSSFSVTANPASEWNAIGEKLWEKNITNRITGWSCAFLGERLKFNLALKGDRIKLHHKDSCLTETPRGKVLSRQRGCSNLWLYLSLLSGGNHTATSHSLTKKLKISTFFLLTVIIPLSAGQCTMAVSSMKPWIIKTIYVSVTILNS